MLCAIKAMFLYRVIVKLSTVLAGVCVCTCKMCAYTIADFHPNKYQNEEKTSHVDKCVRHGLVFFFFLIPNVKSSSWLFVVVVVFLY